MPNLFWLNGDIRAPVLGIPNATNTQRRQKSFPITGLYSPALDDVWDPAIDELKVTLSGVEGAITLNVDSIDFAALGAPADAPWDGEAVEAGSVAIQKFMALTMAEVWTRLGDGTLRGVLNASTADIGRIGMQQQVIVDAAFLINTQLTEAIDLGVARLVAVQVPAGWEGTGIAFDASYDGVTFSPLYTDAGVEKTLTVAGNRYVICNPADFLGVRRLKVRALTVQTAARTLRLVTQP